MQIYSFSIHSADNAAHEHTGRIALSNDNEACDFGEAMIRDMLRDGPALYAGWIMNVTQGTRVVCSINISAVAGPELKIAVR